MLKYDNVNGAAAITNMLTDEEMTLCPKAGSPIAFLNAAMTAVPFEEGKDKGEDTVVRMSDNNVHTTELVETVKLMKNKLAGLHNFVRNSVNPLIKETLTDFYVRKAELENTAPIKLKMVPLSPNVIYEDWKLAAVLAPWEEETFSGNVDLPDTFVAAVDDFLTVDSFVVTCSTGSDELDEFIRSNAAVDDLVPNTWFKNVPSADSSHKVFIEHHDMIDMFFIRGLLNGRLPDFPVELIDSNVRAALTTAMRVKAQQLLNRLSRMDTILENTSGNFFISAVDSIMYVNHSLYVTWLEGNGTVEALTGAIMSHGFTREAVGEAMEQPDTYAGILATKMGQKKALSLVKIRSELEDTVSSKLTGWINSKEDFDLQQRATMHKRLAEQISNAPYGISRDEHDWVRETVCKVMAKDLFAYELLDTMEAHLASDENSTVEDAAIYASSYVLAKWIATLVEVTKSKNTRFAV